MDDRVWSPDAVGEVQGWSDEIDDVLGGDLVAATAYVTPAGGAVVTGVAPCGLRNRSRGLVGFTTSLGFGAKLDRIVLNPNVALAFHTREHGRSTSRRFVLVQGSAHVDLVPDRRRLEALVPHAERHLGPVARGRYWDRWLREYYADRVFVEVAVRRIVSWPTLDAVGDPDVLGEPLPPPPAAQARPAGGTAARVAVGREAAHVARLPHLVLGFVQADGLPAVMPVRWSRAEDDAFALSFAGDASALGGGRRAGLLAHRFNPRLVGLAARVYTGWVEVGDSGQLRYHPHTAKGFAAPANKRLLLIANGLRAKIGLRQARRRGDSDRLQRLASGAPG